MVSPGVPVSTPQIDAARRPVYRSSVTSSCSSRRPRRQSWAITGSNRKSTVTTLLGEMAKASGLQVAVGGNLGTRRWTCSTTTFSFMCWSCRFQLETTESLQAAVATVLNVSADHMDAMPISTSTQLAKARILRGAGVGVYNADDPLLPRCRAPVMRGISRWANRRTTRCSVLFARRR